MTDLASFLLDRISEDEAMAQAAAAATTRRDPRNSLRATFRHSGHPQGDSVTDTTALWVAVDQITKPTHRNLQRDEQPPDPAIWHTAATLCDVQAYRAAMLAYGQVPSLWQQAIWALTTGSESAAGNPSPLAQRSPADLDLMETMATIRETISMQLDGRKVKARGGVPAQIRQLASHLIAHEPEHVEWWTFRIAQWARLLAVYLRAVDIGPRPVRLRNAPCPLCKTRQVTIEQDGELKVVPPILIDFEHGWIRAAKCEACGHAWFRGEALGELANLLDTPTSDDVADTA